MDCNGFAGFEKYTSHWGYIEKSGDIHVQLYLCCVANLTSTRKCGYLTGYSGVQVPSAEE